MRLIVDGMNVIGSRPDRWWRDRRGAMRRLVAALDALSRETGDDVLVVLDASPFEAGGRVVEVMFAPGGPHAADDAIVTVVESARNPGDLRVATSDKELARRVESLGAEVTPAGELRAQLDRFAT